jgi:hypothetical protein
MVVEKEKRRVKERGGDGFYFCTGFGGRVCERLEWAGSRRRRSR